MTSTGSRQYTVVLEHACPGQVGLDGELKLRKLTTKLKLPHAQLRDLELHPVLAVEQIEPTTLRIVLSDAAVELDAVALALQWHSAAAADEAAEAEAELRSSRWQDVLALLYATHCLRLPGGALRDACVAVLCRALCLDNTLPLALCAHRCEAVALLSAAYHLLRAYFCLPEGATGRPRPCSAAAPLPLLGPASIRQGEWELPHAAWAPVLAQARASPEDVARSPDGAHCCRPSDRMPLSRAPVASRCSAVQLCLAHPSSYARTPRALVPSCPQARAFAAGPLGAAQPRYALCTLRRAAYTPFKRGVAALFEYSLRAEHSDELLLAPPPVPEEEGAPAENAAGHSPSRPGPRLLCRLRLCGRGLVVSCAVLAAHRPPHLAVFPPCPSRFSFYTTAPHAGGARGVARRDPHLRRRRRAARPPRAAGRRACR